MAEMEKQLKALYGEAYFKAYLNDAKLDAWYQEEHDRIVKLKN
ncbi:MAG: hypothetical protein O7D34_03445 [Ignavibacteria bacterium]|nr:hypothetical protein [Ignavibacteria bacterium]